MIPGGVRSADDVKSRLRSDSRASTHYRHVSVASLRPVALPADRLAYVSYRTDAGIYWTKHRVSLRRGELVLTDGRNEVRGRCGNLISDTPQQPIAQNEPPAGTWDEVEPVLPTWDETSNAARLLQSLNEAGPVTNLSEMPKVWEIDPESEGSSSLVAAIPTESGKVVDPALPVPEKTSDLPAMLGPILSSGRRVSAPFAPPVPPATLKPNDGGPADPKGPTDPKDPKDPADPKDPQPPNVLIPEPKPPEVVTPEPEPRTILLLGAAALGLLGIIRKNRS